MGMAMGGAMGQQMAGMMNGMNQTMQQPATPQQPMATPTPPPMPGAVNYMIAVNGQQYGPYNMQQMVATGQFTVQTHVWCQGMTSWGLAANRSDLAHLFAPAAPSIPPMPPTP